MFMWVRVEITEIIIPNLQFLRDPILILHTQEVQRPNFADW